ncbi:DNA-binding protein WhiA [Acidaminobacterium chupaoyuni]
MSFTTDIKTELCRMGTGKDCCARAELYGMLLYASAFSSEKIRLQSDSPAVRRRVQQLMQRVTGCELQNKEEQGSTLRMEDPEELRKVFRAFGYEYSNAALHLNRAVVDEECCRTAFVRGAFLTGGYASKPGKGYHLELTTSHYNVAKETALLLEEMNIPCGFVERRGNFVLYYKDSAVIEDLISSLGATSAAMSVMLRKVEKDVRNHINRKVNCETANLDKTMIAATKQVEAISILMEHKAFDDLPQALRETAMLRLEFPDQSLAELAEHFQPPLTKPGLNNRLRKLQQLAQKVRLDGGNGRIE